MKPAMTPQQGRLTGDTHSAFALYRDLAVGEASLPAFLYYEFCQMIVSGLPGIAGLGLRSLLYPGLFGKCGRRPAVGRSVVIRRPGASSIGDKVLLDDFSVLDARGPQGSIELGNYVSIGRFTSIVAKDAKVLLEDGVNIGSYCRVATQSKVHIGESALIAAYCYIGPGNHQEGDEEVPLIAREMDLRGGVAIGKHAWIGAHSTIVDGVSIGEGSIIGAHSFVKSDIPAHVLAAGVPARVIRELKR